MVTKFFRQLGFVKFLNGFIKYKRFQFALRKCARLNREKSGKHIVVSCNNRPLILSKSRFKKLKSKGFFRPVPWGTIVKMQITQKDF